MAKLILENLCKHFGDVKAVDDIDLTVQDGEFLTFLGPSGCGKSTTLFAVAGLDERSICPRQNGLRMAGGWSTPRTTTDGASTWY